MMSFSFHERINPSRYAQQLRCRLKGDNRDIFYLEYSYNVTSTDVDY